MENENNEFDEDMLEEEEDGTGNEDEITEDDAINLLRLTTSADGEAALSGFNDYQLTRLARRAEEEAELNRAILMSLQYANASSGNSDTTSNTGNAEAGAAANTAEGAGEGNNPNVETLMAMGFTRAQSTQALRETRGNVELAANRLLGLDF